MNNTIRPVNKGFEKFDLFLSLKTSETPYEKQQILEIEVKKNEYIYLPLNKKNYIYEVICGAVKLGGYADDGESFVYEVLPATEFFGNFKYLNGQFQEYAKALVNSKIRLYDLDFFKTTIVTNPIITNWFISYLVKRWCSAELKLKNSKEKQIEERIAALQKYYDIPITDTKGCSYILFDVLSKKDMGDLIGVTRQTVSSVLQKRNS
ncbi:MULTISPECIES: Crp/Fnr family transcriptional regulator [unclassified Polaribacter]|uniref:Crp/Fnr family transcriptional regulator n=1 Tax=unclassified Polaribacter TaxID=196858 RepID=UPI0011BF4061|nr:MULTISPECIES: Crp/Fnr family transcriptional regulator [unclassified Polaribacter]TXD51384.1 Crp/Fnr family transcriptional regulator [Polaribacter sp. IC063]TXD62311.1 Crp/Fnr family transcriptional regulator [Polaribacter sp. IC066]